MTQREGGKVNVWKPIEGLDGISSMINEHGAVMVRNEATADAICLAFLHQLPALMEWAERLNLELIGRRKTAPWVVKFDEWIPLDENNPSGGAIMVQKDGFVLRTSDTGPSMRVVVITKNNKADCLRLSHILRHIALGNVINAKIKPNNKLDALKTKVDNLNNTCLYAISEMGSANYSEREVELRGVVNKAFDDFRAEISQLT